ncbi:MAG TPA: gluconate 2-dehydrogenase subunit 3 family protein [Natronoarchaeum rubrum]|nr:gluconate 2-dehydrogenase subunit 3 family protein [Natronoarchaeum rubrum]
MELTRRDAVAALAAVGGTGAIGLAGLLDEPPSAPSEADQSDEEGTGAPDDAEIEATLVATAEVVYPSEVSGVETFVGTFLSGRLDRDAHAAGMGRAVADLDELATDWYDDRFAALDPAERDSFLRELGADIAEEDPVGTTAERVRYYVVNEVLLALYASPTGGELVGIENPQGHPGGQASYQRGPQT